MAGISSCQFPLLCYGFLRVCVIITDTIQLKFAVHIGLQAEQ